MSNDKKPDDKQTASSWTVRQSVERLLDEEFALFKAKLGCDTSDNFEATTASVKAIQYLKKFGSDDSEDE